MVFANGHVWDEMWELEAGMNGLTIKQWKEREAQKRKADRGMRNQPKGMGAAEFTALIKKKI